MPRTPNTRTDNALDLLFEWSRLLSLLPLEEWGETIFQIERHDDEAPAPHRRNQPGNLRKSAQAIKTLVAEALPLKRAYIALNSAAQLENIARSACASCGRPFTSRAHQAKYCSSLCREREVKRRYRAKKRREQSEKSDAGRAVSKAK